MNTPKSVQKYLSKQNLENWTIETKNNIYFNTIVVIPAINEFENIKKLISCFKKNSQKYLYQTLILFIINNIDSDNEHIKEENLKSLNYLRDLAKSKNINIGVIDASSPIKALPNKIGGVGFARKIGMDLSLKLFDYTNRKKNIFVMLDADCHISDNYLSSIINTFEADNINASVIKYEHSLPENESERLAIINYEIFLRYYVLGLKYADSPFAYHSIGSTIACLVESYIKVGGMNKRKAGEDFYFLEKLRKLYTINYIENTTVIASPRISSRVPFGTGPRIKRFLDGINNEYLLYDPGSFEILKGWLKLLHDEKISNKVNHLLTETRKFNLYLHDFLLRQNFKSDWESIISNSNSSEQLAKQKIVWMDAFRTLKLIHFLRDNNYPNVNMFYALNKMFEKIGINNKYRLEEKIPSLDIQLKYLDILRSLT